MSVFYVLHRRIQSDPNVAKRRQAMIHFASCDWSYEFVLVSFLLSSEDKSKGCEHQSEDEMSDVLKTVSETVNDLHQSGAIDETTLNQFEEVCSRHPNDAEETKIQDVKEKP